MNDTPSFSIVQAKQQLVIPHDPCLFRRDSKTKVYGHMPLLDRETVIHDSVDVWIVPVSLLSISCRNMMEITLSFK